MVKMIRWEVKVIAESSSYSNSSSSRAICCLWGISGSILTVVVNVVVFGICQIWAPFGFCIVPCSCFGVVSCIGAVVVFVLYC